jgi:tetratricopeptide (TPR) repeat protein/transglutaminase-like putative cysteine protease
MRVPTRCAAALAAFAALVCVPVTRPAGQMRVAPPSQASAERTTPADGSGQDLVVEQFTVDVVFNHDGTYRQESSARVRIQSDAALQQLGVLSFPYDNATDRIESIDIRVHKSDGSVVVTPASSVQDLAAEVTRLAPTYSDTREKQVPVKALGVGDVLEYREVFVRVRSETPGHFWYAYDFFKDRVVLAETLRISVPSGQYVKVSSPSLKPDVRAENGRTIYVWNSSCAEPREPDKDDSPQIRRRPAVQLTTFRSWAEVGQWYNALQKSRLQISPAVRAKAAELTAGLTSDLEKQRAIYRFVSTKFRYISVSFGQGRYQPHAADETLANEYGDCKDKHTLFAALLKAAGIEAWAALVGDGLDFDQDLPSPAQFNHVVTYLPHGGGVAWLDTTPEVAPYGYLRETLRDQPALLIPATGDSRIGAIPAALPFPSDETVSVQSKLSADGALTGHFDITARGDSEFLLRAAFHGTAPLHWQELARGFAAAMGFAGEVHGLSADSPGDLDAPFHYSYDYEQKTYGDWPNRKIPPPLPPFTLVSTDEKQKPKDSRPFLAPGKISYRATVQLPEGYSIEIPPHVSLQSEVADYTASYAVDKGTLSVERSLTVKASKITAAQWDAYCKFANAVEEDADKLLQLVHYDNGVTAPPVTGDLPEANELIRKAAVALSRRDYSAARDALSEVERLNPKQTGLWAARGYLYAYQGQIGAAVDSFKKEIQFHPDSANAYIVLAAFQRQIGQGSEALDTLRQWVKAVPESSDALASLASTLVEAKKYGEAVDTFREAVKKDPDNLQLNRGLADALLRSGQKTDGLALVATLREKKLDARSLNEIAWSLADTGTEPGIARDLSAQGVALYEDQLKQVSLQSLSREQLDLIGLMAATWDTLGWAYFELGQNDAAESYLNAAWLMIQDPICADHLGQLYERQGKKAEAIRFYQLALAVNRNLPETRARLEKLGGPADGRPTPQRGAPEQPGLSAAEEVSNLRTTPLPELKLGTGSADFFLLFSPAGVEDVQFIRGDEDLKPAISALRAARYKVAFPDHGPERVPRRGTLSCTEAATPACSMVLVLPSNTALN